MKIIPSAEAAAADLISDPAFPGSLISFPHTRKVGHSFINSSSETSIVEKVEIIARGDGAMEAMVLSSRNQIVASVPW